MVRGGEPGGPGALEELAAFDGDLELRPHQRLGGGGAEADDHPRLDEGELGLQPGAAGPDLPHGGFGVDPLLPPRLPLEVLDRVGDEDLLAADPRLHQGFVEHPARRADEGLPRQVFLIPRLLADEAGRRSSRALPQHRLGGLLIEVAGRAALGRLPEPRDRRPLRNELECGWVSRLRHGFLRCRRYTICVPPLRTFATWRRYAPVAGLRPAAIVTGVSRFHFGGTLTERTGSEVKLMTRWPDKSSRANPQCVDM